MNHLFAAMSSLTQITRSSTSLQKRTWFKVCPEVMTFFMDNSIFAKKKALLVTLIWSQLKIITNSTALLNIP